VECPSQPAAHQQTVDRPHEIVHVDDQHRVAVLEERGTVDVGYRAEAWIERPHLQVPLAQERIDDHAELLAAVADDDHGHRIGRRATTAVEVEDLGGDHQPDGNVVALEVAESS
jgi:hypothetical protein